MKKKLFFILISLSLIGSVFSQTELTGWGKIIPKDDSFSDKSFSEFYVKLKEAVDNHNVNFIHAMIFPEIELKYNEPKLNNIESFKTQYNLTDTTNEFWKVTKKLLSMGAFRQKINDSDVFFFPAGWFSEYYDKILGEDFYLGLDSNQNYANAISDNVVVYKEADENSDVIGKLNYEIILINNFEYEKNIPWYKIELKDGTSGYVKNEDIYLSLFDYFMVFKKIDGSWKMMAFERTGV